jgi:hypothetical protein
MLARKIKFKFLALMVVLLFSGLAFGEHQVLVNGNPKNFEYRRTITIQSSQVVGGPHSNYPMLFDSTKPTGTGLPDDLRTQGYSGKVRNDNGDDIVFATGNGIEVLKHEIEYYDDEFGVYVAWVRIESIDNGTVIYLYYGSDDTITYPANFTRDVWSNNYRGVWHLSETAIDEQSTATHYNSCSADNNGSQNGNASTGGKIAGAQDFSLDDYIEVPDHNSIDFGTSQDFTLSLWINSSQAPREPPNDYIWPYVMSKDNRSAPRYGYNIFTMDGTPYGGYWEEWSYFKVYSSGASTAVVISESGLVDGNWHYIAGKRDGVNLYTYFDGNYSENTDSDGGADHSNGVALRMGTNIDNDEWGQYEGLIDEVRISGIARPNGWIKTEHNNQNAPESFYSISAPTLVELSYFRATSLDSAVLLEWATETELDNAGFNIWRKEEKDGEYVRKNPYFIPAEGEAGFGAEYSFTDYNVQNGRIYYYKLEDTDIYGNSSFHGPVPATPNDILIIWPDEGKILPSGALLFSWASEGNYSFKVEISPNPSFQGLETLSFPEDGWISGNSLWLRPDEWEVILRKVWVSGGQLFWRVRAKSPDGKEIYSNWRRFTVEGLKHPEE